jgi:hypothetical protein
LLQAARNTRQAAAKPHFINSGDRSITYSPHYLKCIRPLQRDRKTPFPIL